MTQDKSNHFVLITVSLTLLISVAVPTMCSQLLGITLCSQVFTALVSSSAVVFIPPPLMFLLSHLPSQLFSPCSSQPLSTSPTHLPVPPLPPCPPSPLHSSLCCCLAALLPENQLSHRHNPTGTRLWYLSTSHCKLSQHPLLLPCISGTAIPSPRCCSPLAAAARLTGPFPQLFGPFPEPLGPFPEPLGRDCRGRAP